MTTNPKSTKQLNKLKTESYKQGNNWLTLIRGTPLFSRPSRMMLAGESASEKRYSAGGGSRRGCIFSSVFRMESSVLSSMLRTETIRHFSEPRHLQETC
jgi:hypothetical protein